jgi:hypothetical protein
VVGIHCGLHSLFNVLAYRSRLAFSVLLSDKNEAAMLKQADFFREMSKEDP